MNSYCAPIADELQRLKKVERAIVLDRNIFRVRNGALGLATSFFLWHKRFGKQDLRVLALLLAQAAKEEQDGGVERIRIAGSETQTVTYTVDTALRRKNS